MTTRVKKPYRGFTYLPHQEAGVKWMIEREDATATYCRGGVLADDMGLGKTWQCIGLLKSIPLPTTLLVAPPVLIKQWTDALERSGIPYCELLKSQWVGDEAADVFITTYDRLWRNEFLVNQTAWDRIVLDEGHYIRNGPMTRRYKSLAALTAARKWILSGTPVQNSKRDFYNLATWLGCDTMTESLGELARAVILRRSITLLANEMPPPPNHTRVDLPFSSEKEKELFHALVGRLEHALENNFPSSCILELYLRIQMFISHPQIYVDAMQRKYGQMYVRDSWDDGATKLEAFRKMVRRSHEPTLVFCHFKKEMDFCAQVATKAGYAVFFVRGGYSQSTREREITGSRTSVADNTRTMLICQITAANCGLNLQHLTRVIFYTQHWNPAVIDQALTRAYRYGQDKEVTVHHLIIGSKELLNIDRIMLSKHVSKRAAAKALLPALEFAYHPKFADMEAESVDSAVVDNTSDPTGNSE